MRMSDDELLIAMSNMMDSKLKPIENRLKRMEATFENNMLPRMQNIESCYVATYERYQNSADKMESVASDVELLKRVVAEHSEKLNQAIS